MSRMQIFNIFFLKKLRKFAEMHIFLCILPPGTVSELRPGAPLV